MPDPGHLATLMNMGMPELKSKKALRETDNNVDRAIDWIFSHPDDDGTDWDKVGMTRKALYSYFADS